MIQDFDFLFAKSKLDSSVIDLSIGENNILREAVVEAYGLKNLSLENLPHIFEYAPPYGYEQLVEELEDTYKSKIIITTGAKMGLAGCFYAMKMSGYNKIHLKTPFWPSLPSLITREGLEYSHFIDECDCSLIVAPNNPNGEVDFNQLVDGPVIHDGAYYTKSYIQNIDVGKTFGSLQIYSMAKMYGISGARIGWICCHDMKYYNYLTKFVESITAGTSTISQALLLFLLNKEKENPNIRTECENYVFNYLENNRKYLFENLDRNRFEFPSSWQLQSGMFAWIKSEIQDFNSVGVNIMPGKPFGNSEYIRINLAVKYEILTQAIDKINKH